MLFESLFNMGSMPAMERLTQFTAQRHRVITHNVANLSTPNFRPGDLSVESFQKALRRAVDQRNDKARNAVAPPLDVPRTKELTFHKNGIEVNPGFADDGILFHDRNNRSVEHQMQALAENTMTHNAALQILGGQFDILNTAIRGRL